MITTLSSPSVRFKVPFPALERRRRRVLQPVLTSLPAARGAGGRQVVCFFCFDDRIPACGAEPARPSGSPRSAVGSDRRTSSSPRRQPAPAQPTRRTGRRSPASAPRSRRPGRRSSSARAARRPSSRASPRRSGRAPSSQRTRCVLCAGCPACAASGFFCRHAHVMWIPSRLRARRSCTTGGRCSGQRSRSSPPRASA